MQTSPSRVEFNWLWMWRALRLRRRQVIALLVVMGILYAVGLVFPIATQKGIDRIVSGRIGPALIGLAAAILVAAAVEAFLLRTRQSIVIELASFIDRRIARLAFAHLMRVRTDVASFRSGETLNRFQQARKIQTFVLNDLPQASFEVGNLIVSLPVVFFYDKLVALALVLVSPLILLAIRAPLEGTRKASVAYYEAMGAQQNVLSESVNAVLTVKSLGFESLRMRLWSETTDNMLAKLRTVMKLQNRYVITTQGVSRLLNLMIVVIAGLQLIRHRITVGDLFALQLLGARITGPIIFGSNVYNRYQEVDIAIRQMAAFLVSDREQARVRPPVRRFDGGGIILRDVSLTYPKAVRPALAGIDLALPERGVIALVGKNGSGKSTLMRVLLGLNRDYSGSIDLAGHQLANYDPRWLRAHIGAVDQDTVLFSGTIRQNLCGQRTISDTILREALSFAGAFDFVTALPDGLDTVLTENGRTLSGGQRQRLSIARAFVRDPRVALFDEPTAFLDPEAAVALEQRLAAWGRERLLILVTHHLAATRDVDRIIVMDEGHLIGDGCHEDLLQTVPLYAALWANYVRNLEDA